jgi:hypothetical protein
MRLLSNETTRPSRLMIVVGTTMSPMITPSIALDPFVTAVIADAPPSLVPECVLPDHECDRHLETINFT